MIVYVVKKPDGQWLERDGRILPFIDMAEAQEMIEAHEPDVIEQGKWSIHALDSGSSGSDATGLKAYATLTLEKFDADGNLIETITLDGEG